MVGEGRSGRVLEFWPSLCVAFSWVGKKRKQPKAETKKRGGDVAAGPSAPVPLAQPANRRVVGASFPAEAGISSAGFRRGWAAAAEGARGGWRARCRRPLGSWCRGWRRSWTAPTRRSMRRCGSATWTPTRRSAAFSPKVSHLAPLPFPLPVSVASFRSAFGSRLWLDWMTECSSRAFSSRSSLEICSDLLLLRWCSGANTLQACGSRAGLTTVFFQILFA
jgi:hypothetical protein